MKFKNILFIVLLFTFSISACTKEKLKGDPTDDKHMLLYDKWWYNIDNQGRGDHLFNSSGTVIWTLMPSEGTWKWKPNDSLELNFPGTPAFTVWFKSIKEDSMEYWPTFEPEGNYYQFSTTKP